MPENKDFEVVENIQPSQEQGQEQEFEVVDDVAADEKAAEQQQIEEYAKEAAVNSVASIIPGASPGLIDKAARIATGTIDFIKNAVVDAPKAISYMIASNLFDDEEIDSPEERKALMMAVNNVYDTVNPASPVIEKLATEANEALEIGIDHHEGKDFLELAEEGDYLDAADAFAGDIASALPSVGAAFLGPGGLALIGGSVFGSKFTEQLESDTDAATWRMGLNAASSAGGEILSEAFTAGLGGGLTKLATKLGPKAAKAILRNTGSKLAFGFTGEGLSEVAADAWDRAGDMALLGDTEAFEGAMREFGKTFLIGGAIGGGITISQLSNKAEPGAVDAVREEVTPQVIKESRRKSAGVINALEAELYEAQVNGDEFLESAIRDEIKAERAKVKKSQVATEKQTAELSSTQVKELADTQRELDEYKRLEKEDGYDEAAQAVIRKKIDSLQEKQAQIFSNPAGKDLAKSEPVLESSKKLSQEAQTLYEEGASHSVIAEKFTGAATDLASRTYYKVDPSKREGSFEDYVQDLMFGRGGVLDLIKTYKPESGVPLGAYVNQNLPKRANRIIQKSTTQTANKSYEAGSAYDVSDPSEIDTTPPERDLSSLGLPQSTIETSRDLAEKFDLKLDAVKTPKDYLTQQGQHFRKFLDKPLKGAIKEQGLEKFVRKNVGMIREAYLRSEGLAKAREGDIASWNHIAPSAQQVIDYATGREFIEHPARSKRVANRKNSLVKVLADFVGQKAWNEYVDANPAVQQRVNEITNNTAGRISENIKEGSSTDFAFQEDTNPVETDFAAQSEITNKVLEKHGQKRLPDSRDPQQYEEMRNWVGDVMSQYFPRSFFTSGGFWNAGNSAAKRGFFYTNATDFEAANEGVTFTEGYDYSKATRFQYKNKTIENLLKSKDKLAQVNKNNQEAFNEMWKTFDKMIKADPKNARMIAAFLKSAQNSQNHLSRTGAPIVAYSKTGPYTEEHAMPQSAVSRYLMNTILEGGDINSALKNTNRNFVQVALNHIDDASLKQNKIGPNGSNLNANMPAGWKPSDNWLARYFNSTSNIDPDSIVFIESGKTVTETYAPRISESIRGLALGQAYRRREQQKIADQTLDAFDFDDTLFKSDSKIVVKNKGVETTLTPEEFSTYKKKADDVFDFGQFNEVINPVALPTLNKMKDAIAAGNNVTILTARHPKAGPAVNETLKQFGIDPAKVKFRGVQSSSPQAKANYIKNAINKYGFKNVFFADDAVQNTDAVAKVIAELGVEGNVETPRIGENIRLTALGQAQKRRQQQAPKPPKGDFDAPNRPGGKSEFGKRAGAEFRFSEYIDEARIPEVTDQIKAQYDGQIRHDRARNLAIEQLRREANYGKNRLDEHIKRQIVADKVADQTNRKIDSALAQKYDFAQLEAESFDAADNVNGIINILNQGWRRQGIESTSDPVYAHAYVVNELGISPAYANKVLARSNGFAAGNLVYVAKDGNKEVALHEYGHIWNHMMQDRNPNTFNTIFDKIQNEAPEVFQQQIDRINSRTYDLKEGSPEWKDEIMAGIIGYHGNAKIKSNSKALNDIIKEYWNSIKKMLGFDYAGKDIADLNVEQVLDLIVDEVVSGKVGNNVLMLSLTKPSLARRGLAFSLKGDPQAEGLKAVKEAYRDSKDLPSAIKAGYEAVKGKYDFNTWAEFANKAIGEVKIGDTTSLSIAKAEWLSANEASLEAVNQARLDEISTKDLDTFKTKLSKVIGKLPRKPNSFFITPKAEDFEGLLYTLLPDGKAGVEMKEAFKKHLIDPYNKGIGNLYKFHSESLNAWKNLTEGVKLNEKVTGTDYTVGDAIKAELLTRQGKETGLSKQDASKLNEFVDQKQLGDLVNGLEALGINFEADTMGEPALKTLNDQIIKNMRKQHLETFNKNLKEVGLDPNDTNSDFWKQISKPQEEGGLGKGYTKALQGMLKRMQSGKNRLSNASPNPILKWLGLATSTTMFWNRRSAVLQMLSAFNFLGLDNNNVFQASAAVLKSGWRSDVKKLWNSPYLKDRRGSTKFDVLASELDSESGGGWIERNINKLFSGKYGGFAPTRFVDSFAIASGGAAFYRNTINALVKQGVDPKEAEKIAYSKWTQQAETTQQSADPSKVSEIQADELGKIFFAFANTPFQYARYAKRKIQDVASGRSTGDRARRDIQTALYYTAGQTLIFTTLQTGVVALAFGDDDDGALGEKALLALERGITSNVKVLGFGGAGAATLLSMATEIYRQKELGYRKDPAKIAGQLLSASPVFSSKYNNFNQFAKGVHKKDAYGQAKGAAHLVEGVSGLPTAKLLRDLENLKAMSEADMGSLQQLALLMGWSKWDFVNFGPGDKNGFDADFETDFDTDFETDFESPFDKGETGQAFNDGTIEVDPNLSPLEREKTIKHEMQHVRDMEQHGLDYDDNNVYFKGKTHRRKNGMIEYNGKMYKEGARELPWERRAYDAE